MPATTRHASGTGAVPFIVLHAVLQRRRNEPCQRHQKYLTHNVHTKLRNTPRQQHELSSRDTTCAFRTQRALQEATAPTTPTASKAEDYVLLGDPEKTTALPDLPRNSEPADKQDKTIVAETPPPRVHANKQDKTVEATHAATYEDALKEAAPDAPPSVGDAAAALKDATLRELGAAREKASTKIKARPAARNGRRAASAAGRRLLALAVVFAGSSSGARRPPIGRHVRPVADTRQAPTRRRPMRRPLNFCGRVFY